MNKQKVTEEETRRFYIFSTEIEDINLVVTIPAETIDGALKILNDTMKYPDRWEREDGTEKELGFERTTINGKKKAPKAWADQGSGPMYG